MTFCRVRSQTRQKGLTVESSFSSKMVILVDLGQFLVDFSKAKHVIKSSVDSKVYAILGCSFRVLKWV